MPLQALVKADRVDISSSGIAFCFQSVEDAFGRIALQPDGQQPCNTNVESRVEKSLSNFGSHRVNELTNY